MGSYPPKSCDAAASAPGLYRADQIHSGDPYEISNGHLIECAPTGGGGSKQIMRGSSILCWDPAVKEAGAAREMALKNLLGRYGYRDLEDVREEARKEAREEGREEGREEALRDAIRDLVKFLGVSMDEERERAIASMKGEALLALWKSLLSERR